MLIRWRGIALLTMGVLLLGGCGRAPEDVPKTARAAAPAPAKPQYSYAQTNDLRVAPQLGAGWYSVEDGGWRWMAREARLTLRSPGSSAPQFEVRLTLPRGQVPLLGPMKLTVLFNDRPFAEQTYTADGDYTLTRAVPPNTLTPDQIQVTLRWDKARAGTAADGRELAAVIVGVGFK